MVSMRNWKNYPSIIIKYPSYLELWNNKKNLQEKNRTIICALTHITRGCLTLLHSEWPKLYGVLAILSAIGLTRKLDLGTYSYALAILRLTWLRV